MRSLLIASAICAVLAFTGCSVTVTGTRGTSSTDGCFDNDCGCETADGCNSCRPKTLFGKLRSACGCQGACDCGAESQSACGCQGACNGGCGSGSTGLFGKHGGILGGHHGAHRNGGHGCGRFGCGHGGKLCQHCCSKGGRHNNRPTAGEIPHTVEIPPAGGQSPTVAYPYYTTRGPRDFLQDACYPPTIMPYNPQRTCLPPLGF